MSSSKRKRSPKVTIETIRKVSKRTELDDDVAELKRVLRQLVDPKKGVLVMASKSIKDLQDRVEQLEATVKELDVDLTDVVDPLGPLQRLDERMDVLEELVNKP